MPAKKILIVEDQKLVLDGMKCMLSHEECYQVVGEALGGEEAVRLFNTQNPDLILLGLALPLGSFSVLREIKKTKPLTRVLILTVHDSDHYVHEAFASGADGYFIRDSGKDELLIAIRCVLEGKMYVSPSVTKMVMAGYLSGSDKNKKNEHWKGLSQRETEVLKLIAEGYKNKEIAQSLGISAKTVEKHRGKVIEKLNLHSVRELTSFAYENGLIGRYPLRISSE